MGGIRGAALFAAVSVAAADYPPFRTSWRPFFNCSAPVNAGAAYCNLSADFSTRAAALVAALTVEEKAGLFMNHARNVSRLEQRPYNWWNEALHGVKAGG